MLVKINQVLKLIKSNGNLNVVININEYERH